MNAETIAKALGGRKAGGGWMARCPAHDDRVPSLSLRDADDGRVLVRCHADCEQRRVIDALRQRKLWPKHPDDPPLMTEADRERQRKQEAARERERARRDAFVTRTWRQAWAQAMPARGSPIERWLRYRGIDPAHVELERMPLRWSPRCPLSKEVAPAMVALMTHPLTGQPCGLHRTFLLPNGAGKAAIEKPRQMLGPAGVIRLSPDDEVDLGLGICEGIETGLAIMAAGWRPIWACGSLGGLRKFPVLDGIECLTIFADPKPHEIAGARECARRWAAAGREAVVQIPNALGDFNDLLGSAP